MEKTEDIEQRSTKRQVLLCLTAYITAIAPSMSIGFSAVSLPSLTDPNDPKHLTIYEASWVASIASIGTPLGCFICGPVSDRYGRRAGLLLVNAISFAGWAVIALASTADTAHARYTQLLLGRFLTGFSTGLVSMPATVYMAETASTAFRLWFTTASAIAFSAGILAVYVLGYMMPTSWGTVAIISASIACFAMFCGICFLPESPIWLVKHNHVSEAENALRRIYGHKTVTKLVENDLQTLIRNRNNLKVASTNVDKGFFYHIKKKYSNLLKPECKKPLIIMAAYFFFQQFSGTFVIIFYAVKIVKISGSNINPFTGMLLIGITRFITAILTCAMSRRYGRRQPSLFSGIGMTIAMFALAIYINVNNTYTELKLSQTYGFLPILCLVLYFLVSTPGFVTVPFAMSAEVFPVSTRGVASGLVSTSAYIYNFIVVKLFDSVLDLIGASAVFGFFGSVAFVGTIFVYKWLPETKGKTMAEIEEEFRRPSSERKRNQNLRGIIINEENVPLKV